MFFTAIPEAVGIIYARGVYRQTSLFERKGKVYAKYGAGFVRLSHGGATSSPTMRWAEIETPEGQWAEVGGFVEYYPNLSAVA